MIGIGQKPMILPVKYSKCSPLERRNIRLEYIKRQNNRSMYCNNLLTDPPPTDIETAYIDWSLFPENFLRHPVHLQHCHKTDYTEGAVHAKCNAYMWYYEGR